MSRTSRRIVIGAVAILGIALAARWWTGTGANGELASLEPYYTKPVERGDIRMEVSATGTLNPVNQVEVGAQITGRVSALYADFNSMVEEGQLVAQLDPTFLKASLEESKANLARSRAETRQKQKDYERSQSLAARNLISQQEMEASLTQLEVARAVVRQGEASLLRAQTNLDYTSIHSPVSGVVIDRQVDVGQTVAASLQAPVLFLIAEDLTRMQLETSIDEADIGRIEDDQTVEFTVDAYPEETFRGTVSQVRLAPQVVQNVTTYSVIIDVANPELKLRPGMTANVTITVAERIDVLRIPSSALRFKPSDESDAEAGTESVRRPPEGRPGGMAGGPGGGGRFRDMSPAERQKALERMPPEVRARIEERMASGEGPPERSRIHVWQDGEARPIPVRVGLDNGTWVEVSSPEIQGGDAVITGTRRADLDGNGSAGLFDMSRFRPGRGRRR